VPVRLFFADAARTADALYMRGTDPDHHIHVTEKGDAYVDHHVFFCVRNERAGLNHLSFEVHDLDDVFAGHEHLRKIGKYEHIWGLGRHLLGSQVFDYWADPWGGVHEHWADTDRLNRADGGQLVAAEVGLTSQWGEGAPEKFIRHVSP